ncbi:hypothetical protein D3C84_1277510 [compost metagenome]
MHLSGKALPLDRDAGFFQTQGIGFAFVAQYVVFSCDQHRRRQPMKTFSQQGRGVFLLTECRVG